MPIQIVEIADLQTNINQAIADTIFIAAKENKTIKFKFNGVWITVRGDSDAQLILRDWRKLVSDIVVKSVGPYPDVD